MAEISSSSNENLCDICKSLSGKYTCPRCSINYCSLTCYKKKTHAQCSEQFYQECVREEVESMGGDNEARKKMEEILRNVRSQFDGENDQEDEEGVPEQVDSDDEPDNDLAERMKGVDLDDSEAVWDKLTEDERKQFVALLDSGKIRETFPDWEPWWVLGENLPSLAPNIPLISTLTARPAPCLPFLVMNTLMAYQLSLRVVRGQSSALSVETATAIWSLSAALRGTVTTPCSSFDDASKLLLNDCEKCDWIDIPLDSEQIAQDVRDLTTTDYCFVLLALSDIKAIIDDAIEKASTTNHIVRFTGPPPKTSNLKKASKKLIFYLAWAKQSDDREWDRLVGNDPPLIKEVEEMNFFEES